MIELREPPRADSAPRRKGRFELLGVLNLVAVLAVGGLVWWRGGVEGGAGDAELARQVAAKLKAAGALEESAERYSAYLESSSVEPAARAKIAYSLGTTYLDRGQYENALRWFYEAETLGAGTLQQEVGQKIVHCLERLGRVHAARAALDARTQLAGEPERGDGDPVVAKIGERELRRSAVESALDSLPPEAARSFAGSEGRSRLLQHYVADELLYEKARKLEYDRDPEVRRRLEEAAKQLAVARFVEREVLAKIAVEDADLANFFAANQARYGQSEAVKLRVLELPDRQKAERLASQLTSAQAFAAAAKKSSLHTPTRDAGGLIDRFIPRGVDFLGIGDARALDAAIFTTDPGQLTPPVTAGGRHFLFRVEERRPAKPAELAEVRQAVERDYLMQKTQAAYQSLVESELQAAGVELFPERMGG